MVRDGGKGKKKKKQGKEKKVSKSEVCIFGTVAESFRCTVSSVQTHVCRSKEWLLLLVADRPRKREERKKGEEDRARLMALLFIGPS